MKGHVWLLLNVELLFWFASFLLKLVDLSHTMRTQLAHVSALLRFRRQRFVEWQKRYFLIQIHDMSKRT